MLSVVSILTKSLRFYQYLMDEKWNKRGVLVVSKIQRYILVWRCQSVGFRNGRSDRSNRPSPWQAKQKSECSSTRNSLFWFTNRTRSQNVKHQRWYQGVEERMRRRSRRRKEWWMNLLLSKSEVVKWWRYEERLRKGNKKATLFQILEVNKKIGGMEWIPYDLVCCLGLRYFQIPSMIFWYSEPWKQLESSLPIFDRKQGEMRWNKEIWTNEKMERCCIGGLPESYYYYYCECECVKMVNLYVDCASPRLGKFIDSNCKSICTIITHLPISMLRLGFIRPIFILDVQELRIRIYNCLVFWQTRWRDEEGLDRVDAPLPRSFLCPFTDLLVLHNAFMADGRWNMACRVILTVSWEESRLQSTMRWSASLTP